MKPNTVSLIILTLVIAGGVYWYFFTGSGNQPPLTVSSGSDNPIQTQFQKLGGELQQITFDVAIFSDPRFTSLVDITVPLISEPSGRLDPFAPIQGVTGT